MKIFILYIVIIYVLFIYDIKFQENLDRSDFLRLRTADNTTNLDNDEEISDDEYRDTLDPSEGANLIEADRLKKIVVYKIIFCFLLPT